ncbi:Polysaccharide deacetylase [Teratosphaeria destructans]|uniref:chitin deacetylase n=1 Tax=Teratosphaeria destructans TaxID=418781 RepID=A0A9W7W7W0_9PEZI|nr:Polysaccharide deacetylase [Teratosphaeria destructans]
MAVWPNGAKAAIAITLDNLGEAADLERGLWLKDVPVGSHYSVTEVLPRIITLLRKYDLPATYFCEASNLSIYPDAIKSIINAGHELAWHAWRHEAWASLDEEAEKANFARSFGQDGMAGFASTVEGLGGSYKGFRPPGGIIHGERTLALCKDYGLSYISPAGHDAALVSFNGNQERMAILPFRWSTVDAYYYMDTFSGLRVLKGEFGEETQPPSTLVQAYKAEIDEAVKSGGYRSVLFHPFLTNDPVRLEAMEEILSYIASLQASGTVWVSQCDSIAAWMYAHPQTFGEDPGWDTASWR